MSSALPSALPTNGNFLPFFRTTRKTMIDTKRESKNSEYFFRFVKVFPPIHIFLILKNFLKRKGYFLLLYNYI
jgi:hypothetical protein